ncbi:MAG: rhodanese-like domain-containing protein [Cyanobacteria bacterium J06633_2]
MTSHSSFKSSIIHLTPEEFIRLPTPPLLIDVRSSIEYRLFHAPDAVNLSLHRILMGQFSMLQPWVLPDWFRDLSRTEAIAVICLTAHRSPIAAQQLIKTGFTHVLNITGGMMAWQSTGLPITPGSCPKSVN